MLNNSGYGQIATKVKSLDEFFKAENYHQDYIAKNPNGYCPDHSTGIRFATEKPIEQKDNSELLIGKSIVVIEPQGYCTYCEKFKTFVAAVASIKLLCLIIKKVITKKVPVPGPKKPS